MKESSQKLRFSIDNSGFFLPSGFCHSELWMLTSGFCILYSDFPLPGTPNPKGTSIAESNEALYGC